MAVAVAVAMPVDERGVAVGVKSSVPAGTEGLEPNGCCVGVVGIAVNGVAVGKDGKIFSVSGTTGVKVSVGSSGGVTEPSSGVATTTASSAVAVLLLWVVGNGVGVIVLSPVDCSVADVGVTLTVSVTTSAGAIAVVDVKAPDVNTAVGWGGSPVLG